MNKCENCGGLFDRPGLYGCRIGMHVKPDLAQKIAAAIEEDICDRRGLRQEFEQIDSETQRSIRDTWANIIRKHLDKAKT